MKQVLVTLLSLLVLAASASHGQDRVGDTLPVYLKFRPLSGLPWKEPGATRSKVLKRIFLEPHPLVRGEVLREYLHSALPAKEFPQAFEECMALEQADFPGATAEFVMRAWAERDPAEAVTHCQTLLDLVIEGAPLEFTSWKTPILVGNLENARASSYWFGNRGVIHACWIGLAVATLPPERRRELEDEFSQAYVRRFRENLPDRIEDPAEVWALRNQFYDLEDPPTLAQRAMTRVEFIRMLSVPPEQIAGMLNWPRDPSKDVIFPRVLIRWMNGDAPKARQIVDRVLDVYDPRRFYRDVALKEVVPVEFLIEWAVLDPTGFLRWAGKNPGEWKVQAVSAILMSKDDERAFGGKVRNLRDRSPKADFDKLWITLDPYNALPWLTRHGDATTIEAAIDDLWRSDPPPNLWRSVIPTYTDWIRRSHGNEASGITSAWGRIDFRGMVKQYGLPWCLHSGEYKRSEIPWMLANRQPLAHGDGLENTLSTLRTWAVLQPKEMRAWIDGEKFDPDLRSALLWVLQNATRGSNP